MNTPKVIYWLLLGNTIKKAMVTGTFKNMGYKNTQWISFNMVKRASPLKRKRWLMSLENRFSNAYQ
jgi:NAD(P)H dehydrogenase (quinone)